MRLTGQLQLVAKLLAALHRRVADACADVGLLACVGKKQISQVVGIRVDGRRVIGLLAAVRFRVSSGFGLVKLRVGGLVAVTDDVMPITEVLQVFPVAVWGQVELFLSPACFAQVASGRGLGTGFFLTAFPFFFDCLFFAQYLFDCILVPFDRTLQNILPPNKMPTGFELWVAAKLCWQVFG
jgi:hypothetical protein